MQTWDAIRSRRNVRAFQDRPVADEDLRRILEAGWRAPSAANRQHWDFIVTTGRPQLEELAGVSSSASHVATSAATITLVLPRPGTEPAAALDHYDLGQATSMMTVAAADLGIGSGHAGISDKDQARRLLGIPPEQEPAYLLAFGYPADRPLGPVDHPKRRPFEEVVHWGHW